MVERKGQEQLARESIPPVLFRLVEFMRDKENWCGTATELLAAMKETDTPPTVITKWLNEYRTTFLADNHIGYTYRRKKEGRLIALTKQTGDSDDGGFGMPPKPVRHCHRRRLSPQDPSGWAREGCVMAGKNSRSSKTAHVLNLLSGGTPEVKPDAVPPPREAPPPAPLEPAPPASDMSVPEAPSSAARRLSPALRARRCGAGRAHGGNPADSDHRPADPHGAGEHPARRARRERRPRCSPPPMRSAARAIPWKGW